jgi:acyl-CoA hydrolase
MGKHEELYKEKLTTHEKIADMAESGWNCCVDNGISIPYAIIDAIGERVGNGALGEITIQSFFDVYPMPCYDDELSETIRGISWFSGIGGRKAINTGHADVMPNYFRDAPSLFRDYIDIDAFYTAAAPMDKHGYFSTCNSAVSFAQSRKAKRIFIEVNENMPRSPSSSFIHISQVTALCEGNNPLPTMEPTPLDDVSKKIGEIIAEEIPNGATIQLGIGHVPNAVGMMLKDKRDLGIHTEMFTDSMVELLECGAANNNLKPIHIGRSVATFAFGSRRMYDLLDDNPSIEMLPVDYVNDPAIIAKHPNMISVNAAVEIDFMGQVCAESIGSRHISGTGGQVDFVRGAIQSKGGKSFIAFTSTAGDGEFSRICPVLKSGAFVTTSKNDVDHVVTEYGIAKLRGKSVYQRTKALIAIAHPKFRDELTYQAKKINIVV